MGKAQKNMATMAGLGLSDADIAVLHDMTVSELLQHHETALHHGRAEFHHRVAQKLFEKIEEGHLSAITFYLKTQCGWGQSQRETNQEGPPDTEQVFATLSDDELRQLHAMAQRMAQSHSHSGGTQSA